jgi:hypothetical protein
MPAMNAKVDRAATLNNVESMTYEPQQAAHGKKSAR